MPWLGARVTPNMHPVAGITRLFAETNGFSKNLRLSNHHNANLCIFVIANNDVPLELRSF